MACNDKETNCYPCKNCQEPPQPVLPRCDIALPDGRYDNATIVVENGCIVVVESGRPMLYTPDVCCVAPGGSSGGGEGPCDCPPGDPGENATISIGEVSTLSPDQKACVRNTGTETNAILTIGLPQGKPGESGANPNGVTDSRGGISIAEGCVVGLPATWPPVLYILGESNQVDVTFDFSSPDPQTGVVRASLDVSRYDANLRTYINQQIANASTPLQTQITSLQSQLSALQSTVTWIQNNCCNG